MNLNGWTLEGFLKGKNKVSKDEVLEYINTNKIDVTEVKLSSDSQKKGLVTDELRQTLMIMKLDGEIVI